jgi:sugar phosphate isomerase/epimerase
MTNRLGIMTRHIARPTIEEVAAAIAGYGLSAVQLNLSSAGIPDFPHYFDDATCQRICDAFWQKDIEITAVSGTFNMIDPDEQRLQWHIDEFDVLCRWCRELGCDVITLCTGTRDAESMWRAHPANAEPEAWSDMLLTARQLVLKAEFNDVTLAFEPEVVNVVDTADKARRLIETIGSARLRLVMDPANYFHPTMLNAMQAVLEDVFAQVGDYIVLAHAKDVRGPDPGGDECIRPAAGTGVLDYALYRRLLREHSYDGALIMHSLSETEIPASAAYVRRYLSN